MFRSNAASHGGKGSRGGPKAGCFTCGGAHYARDCAKPDPSEKKGKAKQGTEQIKKEMEEARKKMEEDHKKHQQALEEQMAKLEEAKRQHQQQQQQKEPQLQVPAPLPATLSPEEQEAQRLAKARAARSTLPEREGASGREGRGRTRSPRGKKPNEEQALPSEEEVDDMEVDKIESAMAQLGKLQRLLEKRKEACDAEDEEAKRQRRRVPESSQVEEHLESINAVAASLASKR